MRRSPLPIGRDVAQRQPNEFTGRIVTGQMSPRFDDHAQPGVDTLNRIGGVDHPPNFWLESKQRDNLSPDPALRCHHGGEFLTPLALFKRIQCGQGRLSADRLGLQLQFADQLGLKATGSIAGHLDTQRAFVGQDGLAALAVAVVGGVNGLGRACAVAQVVAHLSA